MRISDWSSDVCSSDLFKVVIPARLGSTRLPGKVLREVGGKPIVQHVWEAAQLAGAEEVVIATDSGEVQSICEAFGASVAMTAATHNSGTDRVNKSEEHTSELQSLMRISYAVFCLKKKKN